MAQPSARPWAGDDGIKRRGGEVTPLIQKALQLLGDSIRERGVRVCIDHFVSKRCGHEYVFVYHRYARYEPEPDVCPVCGEWPGVVECKGWAEVDVDFPEPIKIPCIITEDKVIPIGE